MPSFMGRPVTDLQMVCEQLRTNLNGKTDNLPMTGMATDYLNRFVGRISEVERLLLPRKKQRALEEMETVLDKYLKQAARNQDQERLGHYLSILNML
jgi:hypothetical protein